jgi:CPA2 family monovalent cation:H+ antiporter-2
LVEAAFLLGLGIVIVGLAALARIAARWQLPAAPLFLLAGLAFGRGGIVPLITAGEFIELGAEIGVILLLFMLGLEYTSAELTAGLRRHAPAGVLDLALNFTPGFVAGLLLGWGLVPAVFLGGITYISSSGIIARLLDDMRWLANRETSVVISILVFEDLVMAGYLSLIAVLVSGVGALSGVLTLALALGAVGALLLVAHRYGNVLSDLVFSRSDQTLVLTVLGITFVVAGLSEQVGISAAVGAFIVGLMLSGDAADRAHDLLEPMRDLFAAIFFVFFGLSIDPATIPPILGVAVAIAVVTAATKVFTGWWSARREGIRVRGRFRAGVALIARGEFSIAIAGIGTAGAVHPELGALAGAYVLILAVAGPVAARVIDPLVISLQARARARAQSRVPRPEEP